MCGPQESIGPEVQGHGPAEAWGQLQQLLGRTALHPHAQKAEALQPVHHATQPVNEYILDPRPLGVVQFLRVTGVRGDANGGLVTRHPEDDSRSLVQLD